jgi:hypothetical protein
MTRQEWLDGTLTDMVRRIAQEREDRAEADQIVRVSAEPLRARPRRRRAARMFPDAPARSGDQVPDAPE